jgi:two-component sensor histidine kinase
VLARRIDSQVEIVVRDNGKGVSNATENASSLGMKLIRAFASQLGGHFTLENDEGTICRLVIPASDEG